MGLDEQPDSVFHRITEPFELKGTLKGHLVQFLQQTGTFTAQSDLRQMNYISKALQGFIIIIIILL